MDPMASEKMLSTLECLSSQASTDEDTVEQVLMRSINRSEGLPAGPTSGASNEISTMQKRFQKLSRNVSELKNSLSIDSARCSLPPEKIEGHRKAVWGSIVRSLTQLLLEN